MFCSITKEIMMCNKLLNKGPCYFPIEGDIFESAIQHNEGRIEVIETSFVQEIPLISFKHLCDAKNYFLQNTFIVYKINESKLSTIVSLWDWRDTLCKGHSHTLYPILGGFLINRWPKLLSNNAVINSLPETEIESGAYITEWVDYLISLDAIYYGTKNIGPK